MSLSVAPVNNPSLVNAPVQQSNINGVISATPGSNGFLTLDSPSASTPAATTPVTSVGGGSGTPAKTPVSQDTINTIMASIAQQVAQNQEKFQGATNQNAGADAQDLSKYNTNTQNNNESHSSAIQNAETAAAQGGQGLRSVMASMGALGGTGQVLANRAVANSANNDIGGADKTYQTNATALDQAQHDYLTAAKDRDITLQNNLSNGDAASRGSGIQSILNAANSLGDTATYNRFLPQLVPAQAAPQAIAPVPIASNPAAVNTYAPTSGLTVNSQPATAASTTPVNSALYLKKNS